MFTTFFTQNKQYYSVVFSAFSYLLWGQKSWRKFKSQNRLDRDHTNKYIKLTWKISCYSNVLHIVHVSGNFCPGRQVRENQFCPVSRSTLARNIMLQIPHRGNREYYTTTHWSKENIAQHQADIWKILHNNTEVRRILHDEECCTISHKCMKNVAKYHTEVRKILHKSQKSEEYCKISHRSKKNVAQYRTEVRRILRNITQK